MGEAIEVWTDLYRRRRGALAAYAIALVGAQEAEDVLHDAMVKLVRSSGPIRDPEAYAFRAVRSCAMDRLARLARRGRERAALVETDFLDDGPADPADRSRIEAVRSVMATLSERQRETLLLRVWCGVERRRLPGRAQVARATGRPLGTVASDHSRALEAMRPTLEKELRHDA